jgi:hypothetical protein
MIKSIFPQDMLNSGGELSIEIVASKLLYFQEQIHLLHWRTNSYAEHMALGGLYEFIQSFRDDVVEKLMGYASRKVNLFKPELLSESISSNEVVDSLITFSHSLMTWARSNQYCDVDNMAQSLSGEAAKIKYLLTLS